MRIGIFAAEIIHIVGGKVFHPVFFGKAQQGLVYYVFPLSFFIGSIPVAHQLHVKIIAKLLVVPYKSLLGLFFSHVKYQRRDLTVQVTGNRYKVILVLLDQFLINTGDVVKAIHVAYGR